MNHSPWGLSDAGALHSPSAGPLRPRPGRVAWSPAWVGRLMAFWRSGGRPIGQCQTDHVSQRPGIMGTRFLGTHGALTLWLGAINWDIGFKGPSWATRLLALKRACFGVS